MQSEINGEDRENSREIEKCEMKTVSRNRESSVLLIFIYFLSGHSVLCVEIDVLWTFMIEFEWIQFIFGRTIYKNIPYDIIVFIFITNLFFKIVITNYYVTLKRMSRDKNYRMACNADNNSLLCWWICSACLP